MSIEVKQPVHIIAGSATTLKVRKLSPRATTPRYHSQGAAGLDLSACLPEGTTEVIIAPGKVEVVPTGIAIAVCPGFEAQVRPRSGIATRHAITLPNAPGTIDSDYRGEVLVPLINLSSEPFAVTHGMRIAQMIIAPVARAHVVEVADLEATARGAGGFGSTGKH
jgi:dUTP pyrophosphatase